jgi:hypothetical protein
MNARAASTVRIPSWVKMSLQILEEYADLAGHAESPMAECSVGPTGPACGCSEVVKYTLLAEVCMYVSPHLAFH